MSGSGVGSASSNSSSMFTSGASANGRFSTIATFEFGSLASKALLTTKTCVKDLRSEMGRRQTI